MTQREEEVLRAFHPVVRGWFQSRFHRPTSPQLHGWPAIGEGSHTLISAPTGSGKTLAAFLWCLDHLVQLGSRGGLSDAVHVLYVSPLKALSNDIPRNLEEPLRGIQALATVRYVIVDEIHALAGNKRGVHLSLSLERLAKRTGKDPVRIGLSATQHPIEEVARFLVGWEMRASSMTASRGQGSPLRPGRSQRSLRPHSRPGGLSRVGSIGLSSNLKTRCIEAPRRYKRLGDG